MNYWINQEEEGICFLESPENYPTLKEMKNAESIFRIWRYHSLSVCSSWLLYKQTEDFFVRRLEWDRTKDNLYFGDSKPTIYGSETEISKEQSEAIIEKLKSTAIQPFLISDLVGIDGTTYGIEAKFENLKSKYLLREDFAIKFSWWHKPIENWKPLADWLDETSDIFDSLLPASTAKMIEAEFRY